MLNAVPRWEMIREDETSVTLLRSKLNALLEQNCILEEKNKQLKQEIHHLKTQITLLQGEDPDRRSMIWKGNLSAQNNEMEGNTKACKPCSRQTIGARTARAPKPPPSPACLNPTPGMAKESWLTPPPPPPPLPLKLQCCSLKAVQRVPEVVEFYRLLTRKEGKTDGMSGSLGIPGATNPREMIGEIENRSAYVLAIKSDVETQGEFIGFLAREVENAVYKEIAEVEAFVKWLDGELSYLVDERAVLKHFPHWPERKADAMREAAFTFRDLKNIESEVSSFSDDLKTATPVALKRMQTLQDKLECGVHNIQRVRDSASRRYREFRIPSEWMLDIGIISQLKLGSMKLAKGYINRVVSVLKSELSSDDEELILRCARFAFRVHQFVGGFDVGCRRAFEELRKLANKSRTPQ